MASSKKRGPKGHFKKRSSAIHGKQEFLSFFEQDYIPSSTNSIDTSMIHKVNIGELYDDMGDNYENLEVETDLPTRFENLPLEFKENLIEEMNKLESVMKERNNIKINREKENLPLIVSEKHRHDTIRIPHNNVDQMDQNIYSSQESPQDVLNMLDNRRTLYLMRIPKYNSFENFINPKIFRLNDNDNDSDYEINIGKFIDDLYSKERIECVSIEFNPENKNIFMAMNLDDRDIFYVCIECILKKKSSVKQLLTIFSLHNNFIDWSLQSKNTNSLYTSSSSSSLSENDNSHLLKEEQKVILNTIIIFQRYYYFTCGCEK